MTPSEAIIACEFWTLTLSDTVALGSSRNPLVGQALGGSNVPACAVSQPDGPRFFCVQLARGPADAPNPLWHELELELARRAKGGTK